MLKLKLYLDEYEDLRKAISKTAYEKGQLRTGFLNWFKNLNNKEEG